MTGQNQSQTAAQWSIKNSPEQQLNGQLKPALNNYMANNPTTTQWSINTVKKQPNDQLKTHQKLKTTQLKPSLTTTQWPSKPVPKIIPMDNQDLDNNLTASKDNPKIAQNSPNGESQQTTKRSPNPSNAIGSKPIPMGIQNYPRNCLMSNQNLSSIQTNS